MHLQRRFEDVVISMSHERILRGFVFARSSSITVIMNSV